MVQGRAPNTVQPRYYLSVVDPLIVRIGAKDGTSKQAIPSGGRCPNNFDRLRNNDCSSTASSPDLYVCVLLIY